jgi:pyruvate,water dikinase
MIIKGKVLVVKEPRDYYKLKDEIILIAKNTIPDITVIINRIKLIIVEIDNKLCHAAIIAREYQKPLIMGAKDATKKFKTGDIAEIDLKTKIISKIQ